MNNIIEAISKDIERCKKWNVGDVYWMRLSSNLNDYDKSIVEEAITVKHNVSILWTSDNELQISFNKN